MKKIFSIVLLMAAAMRIGADVSISGSVTIGEALHHVASGGGGGGSIGNWVTKDGGVWKTKDGGNWKTK